MGTLSEKRHPDWKPRTEVKGWYLHDDVKEFIKKIKGEAICKDCSKPFDEGCDCDDQVFLVRVDEIDRHAGEEF